MKITEHDNAILLRAARVIQKILGRIEMVEYRTLFLAVGRDWAEINPVGHRTLLRLEQKPIPKLGKQVIRAHDKELKEFLRAKK